MNTNTPITTAAARRSLLDQIAGISTMQPGTLAEEWRLRPDPSDPSGEAKVRLGPYYKHQVWKDGRNISRRVPAGEAAFLRMDIDNTKHFEQLTSELANLNFDHTTALRATQSLDPDTEDSKKNSKPKPATKNSPKPKPSSPKPKRL